MSMVVAHNMSAINTKRQFATSARGMSSAMEKLSSGYKINAGKDDPSGLVISEKLRSQINGLQRAQQNTEEAINVMGIAEGALNEMNNILKKMKALAIHSSNTGVTSPDQIAADQAEMDSSIQTLDRIAKTTNFSGDKLLNGAKDIVFDQDTLTKGTQQNSLVNANGTTFSQIFKRDAFNVSINYTGSTDASARTGTGTVDFSQQAMKAYFEVDTAADPENRAQVKNGVFTQAQSFTLTGNKGTRAFNFKQGDSVAEMVNQIKSAADTTGIDAALVFNSEQEIAKLHGGGGNEQAVLNTYETGLKDASGDDLEVQILGTANEDLIGEVDLDFGVELDDKGNFKNYTVTLKDEYDGDKTVAWDGKTKTDLGKMFGRDDLKGLVLQGLSGDVDLHETYGELYTAESLDPVESGDNYAGAGTGKLSLDISGMSPEAATKLNDSGATSVNLQASGPANNPTYTVNTVNENGGNVSTLTFSLNDIIAASQAGTSGIEYYNIDGEFEVDLGAMAEYMGQDGSALAGAKLEVTGGNSAGAGTASISPVNQSSEILYGVNPDQDLTAGSVKIRAVDFDASNDKIGTQEELGYISFDFSDEYKNLTAARFTERDEAKFQALRDAVAAYDPRAKLELDITINDPFAEKATYTISAKVGTNSVVLSNDWDGEADISFDKMPDVPANADTRTKNLHSAIKDLGGMKFAGELDRTTFGEISVTNVVDGNGAVQLTDSIYGKNNGTLSVNLDTNALNDHLNTLRAAYEADPTNDAAKEMYQNYQNDLRNGDLKIEYSVGGNKTHGDYTLDIRVVGKQGDVYGSTSLSTAAGGGINADGTINHTAAATSGILGGANITLNNVVKYDTGAVGAINPASGSGKLNNITVETTYDARDITGSNPASVAFNDMRDDATAEITSKTMNKTTRGDNYEDGIAFKFNDLIDTDGNKIQLLSDGDTLEMRKALLAKMPTAIGLDAAQFSVNFTPAIVNGNTVYNLAMTIGSGATTATFNATWDGDKDSNIVFDRHTAFTNTANGAALASEVKDALNQFDWKMSGDIDTDASLVYDGITFDGDLGGTPYYLALPTETIAGAIDDDGTPVDLDVDFTLGASQTQAQAALNKMLDGLADEDRAAFLEDYKNGNLTVDYSFTGNLGGTGPTATDFTVNMVVKGTDGKAYINMRSIHTGLTAASTSTQPVQVKNTTTGAWETVTNATLGVDTGGTNFNKGGLVFNGAATYSAAFVPGQDTDDNNELRMDINGAFPVASNTLTGREGINAYDDTHASSLVASRPSWTIDNSTDNSAFRNAAGTAFNTDFVFDAKVNSSEARYKLQEAMKNLEKLFDTPGAGANGAVPAYNNTLDLTFRSGGTDGNPSYEVLLTLQDTDTGDTYEFNVGTWNGSDDSINFTDPTFEATGQRTTDEALQSLADAIKGLGGFNVDFGGADPATIDHAQTAGGTTTAPTVPVGTRTTATINNLYNAGAPNNTGGSLDVTLTEDFWNDIYDQLDANGKQAFEAAANNNGIFVEITATGDHNDLGLQIRLHDGVGALGNNIALITIPTGSLGDKLSNGTGVVGGQNTIDNATIVNGGGGGTTTGASLTGITVNVRDPNGAYMDGVADPINTEKASAKYNENLDIDENISGGVANVESESGDLKPAVTIVLDNDSITDHSLVDLSAKNVVGGVGTASEGGSAARKTNDVAVFNNTTEKGTGKVTQGVSGIQISEAGRDSIKYGGNTDGQGRIFVKFLDDNKFELYKDSSMSAESKVGSGISGQEITEFNNSGLTGLTLDLTGTELAGKKGVYVSFAGIEGQSGISYDGDVVNTAKSVVDKDGKAVLDADGNPVTTFDGAARFDADRTLVTGVELGTNTSSDGVIYLQNKYTIDKEGNATIQVSAFKNKNARAEDLVAQSQVYQVGKFMLDEKGELAKDENGNLIPDDSFEATSITVVLNETRNADDTEGTGLGMVLSIDTAAFKGQTESTTLEGNMTFTNLGARIYSQDYGSDAYVKITQSKGAIFNYYDRAGDASSKRLVDAGKNGTTFQMNGQDATVSVNGMAVRTSGLNLRMASQDIQASFTFNQGKVGSTTLAQVGYDIGSIFTRIGALNYGSAEADEEGMSGLLCNAGHVTQERIGNFQGGMQLQLGEGPGDQDRTVVAMKSLTSDNLGKVTRSGAWDVGSSVITERTFSMQDVAGGGMAELKSDPILAMAIIEQAISDVTEMRATIGAFQTNLLQTNSNNLSVTIENITKTESGIRDADMADEMAEFTKQQVLQNAAMSMMGQANQASQNVLQLLR